MPSPHAVRANSFVQWLGPWVQHPRLWHIDRRGIALGMAIGLFFGLLVMAVAGSVAGYATVMLLWRLQVALNWRRRRRNGKFF